VPWLAQHAVFVRCAGSVGRVGDVHTLRAIALIEDAESQRVKPDFAFKRGAAFLGPTAALQHAATRMFGTGERRVDVRRRSDGFDLVGDVHIERVHVGRAPAVTRVFSSRDRCPRIPHRDHGERPI